MGTATAPRANAPALKDIATPRTARSAHAPRDQRGLTKLTLLIKRTRVYVHAFPGCTGVHSACACYHLHVLVFFDLEISDASLTDDQKEMKY